MMIEPSSTNLPPIGYLYHYPDLAHPSAKFRMDIFIAETPTEQHFDVLRAHFCVKTSSESIDEITVTHPWPYEQKFKVCPGVVVLDDRKGKKEEAFSFGGQLTISEQASQTVCQLVSKAPILEISGARPVPRSFIEELEIILAQLQAGFKENQEYKKQMCQIDPFRLYQACLQELIEKLKGFHHKDENSQQLLAYLQGQLHRLAVAGMITEPFPTLENIFE